MCAGSRKEGPERIAAAFRVAQLHHGCLQFMGELALPGEPRLFKDISIQSVPTSWLTHSSQLFLVGSSKCHTQHTLSAGDCFIFSPAGVSPPVPNVLSWPLPPVLQSLSVSIAQGQGTYRVWVSPGSHQTETALLVSAGRHPGTSNSLERK